MDDKGASELILQVHADAGGPEEVERATLQLREELKELAIDWVQPVRGDVAPHGSKTAEVMLLGALAVNLAPTVMPPLIDFLKSFVARKNGRSISIKKRVGNKSIELQIQGSEKVEDIEAFIKAASRLKM